MALLSGIGAVPASAEVFDGPPYVGTDRLAGDDRYATAVAISEHAFPDGAEEVYLARADVFADAVAAGALTLGPILLVPSCDTVPGTVKDEISRLTPTRVYALGGPGAICDTTLKDAAQGRSTDRLAGDDRYATAVAISQHEFEPRTDAVHLARADVLADAVAAGALSTGPVLLVESCSALPAVVGPEIDRVEPDRVLALGGTSAVCDSVLAAAADHAPCRPDETQLLGPGSLSTAVVGAEVVGNELFFTTRSLNPPAIGVYDLDRDRVVDVVDLPTSQGAWATAADDTSLYVGTYLSAHLYEMGVDSRELTHLTTFGDASHVWALAVASDGTVYAGTSPDGTVHAHDPVTGSTSEFATPAPDEDYVRSLAVTDTHVYAGIGAHADLFAIDRLTGQAESILPPELGDETFIYTLELVGDKLVAGTEPSAKLAIIDTADPSDYEIVDVPGERTIDALTSAGDTAALLTSRMSGTLYHLDLSDPVRLTTLATPVPGDEHRLLAAYGGDVIGVGGSGQVWRYDTRVGSATVVPLADAGFAPRPEPIQSITWHGDRLHVGGHWGLQVHDLDARTSGRVRVVGEPKALASAGGRVYAAMYPTGEIWSVDGATGGSPTHVATIGHEQIRPRDMHHDPIGDRLLIASQPEYGHLDGAFSILSLSTGSLTVDRGLIEGQSVRSVTADGEVAYLGSEIRGGLGADPEAEEARFAAYDLDAGTLQWEITPVPGATSIVDVTVLDGVVYGLSNNGRAFAVDPGSGAVVHTQDVGGTGQGLAVEDGLLYASSGGRVKVLRPPDLSVAFEVSGVGHAALAEPPPCGLVSVRRTRGIAAIVP